MSGYAALAGTTFGGSTKWIVLLSNQKHVSVNAGLLEDGAQRSFGYIARVVGDGGVALERWIEPNLVRAGRLAMKFQAQRL
jgi:hypothetical protein